MDHCGIPKPDKCEFAKILSQLQKDKAEEGEKEVPINV